MPLLFFVTIVLLVISGKNSNPVLKNPEGNSAISPASSEPSNNNTNPAREGAEGNVEDRPGLQKKENLPDSATKYYFTSPLQGRPNMIISKADDVLFQSSVTDPKYPVKITDYSTSYGAAKWVFKGSNFYGLEARSYIYPERGFAFIGNPTTGEVLEQHLFHPTKVEDYLKKYGDDIPAYP